MNIFELKTHEPTLLTFAKVTQATHKFNTCFWSNDPGKTSERGGFFYFSEKFYGSQISNKYNLSPLEIMPRVPRNSCCLGSSIFVPKLPWKTYPTAHKFLLLVIHHFVDDIPRRNFFSMMSLSRQPTTPWCLLLARHAISLPLELAMWPHTHLY